MTTSASNSGASTDNTGSYGHGASWEDYANVLNVRHPQHTLPLRAIPIPAHECYSPCPCISTGLDHTMRLSADLSNNAFDRLGGNRSDVRDPDTQQPIQDAIPSHSIFGSHLTDVLRYWDVPENQYAWSLPRLELLLGYPPEAVEPATSWWEHLMHSDDRARVLRSLQRFTHSPETRFWAEEYRVLAADGEYVTVIDQLRVLARDKQTGAPTRCIGALFSPVQRQQVDDILLGPRARVLREIQRPREFSSSAADLIKTVTDNSTSCLFMMDSNGHPTYMNRAAEQLTGWTLAEIQDRPLHYAVHYKKPDGSPYPLEECPIDNSHAELRPLQNQQEIFCDRWGRLFPVVWSVAPLAKGGRTIGAVIEFRDVTHERKTEAEKLRLLVEKEGERAKMEEAEAHRGRMAEFVDYICHEIRNPLHGISASADFLATCVGRIENVLASVQTPYLPQDDQSASSSTDTLVNTPMPVSLIREAIEEAKDYVKSIRECCKHQTLITNNVLDLSRLESGKVEALHEVFDPARVAAQCMNMVSAKARTKNIDASLQLYQGTHLVYGDPMRWSQVLINLTSNALKFTDAGQSITVVVHAPEPHPDGSAGALVLRAAVRDTGIGMAPEEVARLFERFGQLHKRISRDYGGSGLGLNISRGLVRLLGGELAVSSEKGVGTCMEFDVRVARVGEEEARSWLVRRAADETEEKVGEEVKIEVLEAELASDDSDKTPRELLNSPEALSPTSTAVDAENKSKFQHILVAEDNIINQKVLATYLKKLGYNHTVCSNGQEAVDYYRSFKQAKGYDCIIMDIEMPIMDGREATRIIRQHEEIQGVEGSGCVIIALSGNARPGLLQEAYDTGLDDYLTKPCSQQDLQRMLAKWETLAQQSS